METISEKKYLEANRRMEELLKIVTNDTRYDSPILTEPSAVSDIIEEYENIHYPL